MSEKVSVILTNRFVKFLKPYPHDELLPYFSFRPNGYRFMPAYRNGLWDGNIRLLKRDTVPTGLFLANWKQIQKDVGLSFSIEKKFTEVEFKRDGVTSDRRYQNECVEKMIAAARHHGGGLLLAATGAGKTLTVALLLSRLVGSACFIVDELTLLKQAQAELSKVLNEKVGIVGKGEFSPERITVATVQTLYLHRDDPKFASWTQSLKVNIIDEIHLALNRRNVDIVEAIAPPVVFGLTATLELQKKAVRVRAYALTGPVCYEYPLEQGQEEGHLARGVVVQILKANPSDTYYAARQFAQEYSDLVVNNPARNKLICLLLREAVKRGKFPIVLVERIRHLKMLSKSLQDIPHRIVCGEKLAEERLSAKKKFEAGVVKILLANKVFQKGIDIKRLDVIIDAGAMKSKNRAVQVFGRGVRLAEGKIGLLHFDIADTENRFEKASKSRRLAFRKRGIPVKKVEWDGQSGSELFEIAEKMLSKEVENERN